LQELDKISLADRRRKQILSVAEFNRLRNRTTNVTDTLPVSMRAERQRQLGRFFETQFPAGKCDKFICFSINLLR
jgi:hypothetical protein